MKSNDAITQRKDYQAWLADLKQSFRQRQIKAAIAVNKELLEYYWQLGSDIVEKQKNTQWGQGFLAQLSNDLMAEFPDIKGFSRRNLELIRQWYSYWAGNTPITQQLVAQLTSIPWGHNQVIINKCKSQVEAQYYLGNITEHGWSRSVLTHHIESNLWQREGQTINNFEKTLPAIQSDLAQQTLKDPYLFDFLALTKKHDEQELERGLVKHITQFLLELGAGFAYMGQQVPITVGDSDFYLDLLFYHTRLRCYVVIELKAQKFKPEHAGKLNFYINAVDAHFKQEYDQPTVGLLLCREKDKFVAEYALKGIETPIGVSEYQLTQALPDNLKSSLPSIEEIERELGSELGDDGEGEL